MYFDIKSNKTFISKQDIEKLKKLKKYLIRKVNLPKLGYYLSLDDEELWIKIVVQFCVMGGTRMIDNLIENKKEFAKFKDQISLTRLLSIKTGRIGFIAKTLKEFKATRFYNRQAEKIDSIMKNPRVVAGKRIVLLDGLSHKHHGRDVRTKLMRRNPYFKLKSTSDFMIDTGLSDDVIALDTRVVGILKEHFNLNLNLNRVQNNKAIYESIESALRKACGELGISLAQLDRMLFRFSNKNAITFVLEDL